MPETNPCGRCGQTFWAPTVDGVMDAYYDHECRRDPQTGRFRVPVAPTEASS